MPEIYDVLLCGGHVIDPKNKIDSVMDVAIKDGLIAAVEPDIKAQAKKTVDVSGLIVTPGLIDIHGYMPTGGSTDGSSLTNIHYHMV